MTVKWTRALWLCGQEAHARQSGSASWLRRQYGQSSDGPWLEAASPAVVSSRINDRAKNSSQAVRCSDSRQPACPAPALHGPGRKYGAPISGW